jgi:hypothetical protein
MRERDGFRKIAAYGRGLRVAVAKMPQFDILKIQTV